MKLFAKHGFLAAALIFLSPSFGIAAPAIALGAEPVSAAIEPAGNYTCDFIVTRLGISDRKRRELMAFGEAIVSAGKVKLVGEWLTEGKYQADPFAGSELAIDDSGNVTGNMSVYHLFQEPNKALRPPLDVVIASNNAPFATPQLGGSTSFDLDKEFRAEWLMINCG